MVKNIIIISLLICLSFPLIAQVKDEDFFEMDYKQKSARKAMLLSTIFPGAGQFYVNPKTPTAYIFSAIEIGLWVGYFHFYNEGKKIEDKYEKYANKEIIGEYTEDITYSYLVDPENEVWEERTIEAGTPIYQYDRNRQYFAQSDLIFTTNFSQSYLNHFRLDDTDTQHFYEDIGKYNKYIFGWADWFDIYATNSEGEWTEPGVDGWILDNNKWNGNEEINEDSEYYTDNPNAYDEKRGIYSGMRAE